MIKKEMIEEGKKVFRYRFISELCLFFSFVVLFFTGITIYCLIISGLLFLSYIIINVIYWRCPNCKKDFELRLSPMDRMNCCPFCGVILRKEKNKNNWF